MTTWEGSVNTKLLQFGVQGSDYANKTGHDNSGYDNDEHMQNNDPAVDLNEPPWNYDAGAGMLKWGDWHFRYLIFSRFIIFTFRNYFTLCKAVLYI